jgi:hypothetical protein
MWLITSVMRLFAACYFIMHNVMRSVVSMAQRVYWEQFTAAPPSVSRSTDQPLLLELLHEMRLGY